MRCLIDTNIVIYREGATKLSGELQSLMKIANSNGITFLVHPLSKKEANNLPDPERREVESSKVNTYPLLESPPEITDQTFIATITPARNENENVDNNLLYAVYKNAIDFLITEDRGIHTKAQKIGMSDKVLTITGAIEYFKTLYDVTSPIAPLALKLVFMHEIDLSDPFFASLKSKYPDFDIWWKKTTASGRKAWVYRHNDGKLGALLILKPEEESIPSNPPLPRYKRVKICTFMSTDIGMRIGELLLKISIDCARLNKIDQLYLTHFAEENDYLIELITQYGFQKMSRQEDGEVVYLKHMTVDSPIAPERISSTFYPSLWDGSDVKKLIVPIQPKYYDRLFTSNVTRQLTFSDVGDLTTERNTILKAYICNTPYSGIKSGDVLLFYRSTDYKSLIAIGTVFDVRPGLRDPEIIRGIVGNRTVYSINEIRSMASRSFPATVILFRYHFDFENPVTYDFLLKKGVIEGPTISITRINDKGYDMVKAEGKIDERFTVH
jgi:hypothetical protein